MRAFLFAVFVLFQKEMRMILKDPRSRTILVVPIMVQTLAFGYVATFDLNSVSYALLDQDRTHASRELIALFDGSGVFRRAATLYNSSAIAEVIDKKRALVVLNIGPHFERKLQMGQNAPVQFIVDGRNGNVAGIAASYAVALIDSFNRKRLSALGAAVPAVRISGRAWYNPNMETRWNMISGMVVLLAVIQVLILSSLSVAREKEQGTFDQLLATPFTPMTILLGKALPPVFVGLVQSSLVLPFALFWFGIPFAGSFALLYLGLLISNFALVGLGLCLSTLAANMQQAMLYAFSLIMPSILLSGFLTPISSMPELLQYVTFFNPLRYGVALGQRIYLEGAGFSDLYHLFAALSVMCAVSLRMAARMFHTRLE